MNKARKVLIALLIAIMAVSSFSVSVCAKTEKAVVSVSVKNVKFGVVTINKGKTFKLEPKVTVTGNSSKSVTYSSANKAIATVNSSGVITAKATGHTEITITSKADKRKKKVIKVYVGKPVTTVTLDRKNATVYMGRKITIKAKTDSAAAYKVIKYTSSDKTIAFVDQNGVVTGLKPGTVRINAYATDNSGVRNYCTVTVKSAVKSFKITNVQYSRLTIKRGSTFTLKPEISVIYGASKEVTYKSLNRAVATVDSKGKITAVKSGKATIAIASKADPTKVIKVVVYVGTPVSSITLDEKNVEVDMGSTYKLNAQVNSNAAFKNLKYYSSNSNVAKVDNNGVITPVEEGSAVIRIYAMDNSGVATSCMVNVVDRAPEKEGYNLVFEDNFSGDALDESKWNYEVHDPGWVNAELQEYVAGTTNTYVENGKLVINPEKDENGNITSGRINTLGKANFKYGYFETRAKVPTGKGYLPAFWLMATDESVYGQWPRCGEIDIMEVMGHETNKTYSTIHYGNPHGQSQVGYVLPEGSFADGYHTYGCDWEPGSIKFYVDGKLVHEVNDWYTSQEGETPITYPAPFDQEFYIILNLAVGGSWVGYPDDSTSYDEDYRVDYVRVYQKDEYNENVERPVEDIVIREPDAEGNYIINGDFSKPDALDGKNAWQFLTAQGGKGSAAIVDNALEVKTDEQGTEAYSVQVVQAELPLVQGKKYELSFDAYADEARTITTGISAPKLNYMRYFGDEKVNLTTERQKFTYTFDMTKATDSHARMEFNLGKSGSTATVHIDNVVVKVIDDIVIDDSKTPRADGNYIYNGKFQEGTNRLGDWEVVGNEANIEISEVTPLSDNRKFHIITKDCADASAVSLTQSRVPYLANSKYKFMIDAKCKEGTATINVWLNGTSYPVEITSEMDTYTIKFDTGEAVVSDDFKIDLGVNQDVYLDNVTIVEDSLIVNGSFKAGLAGYEVYKNSGTDATAVVDSLTEDNAFDITIRDTGAQDWEIQLKQNNVELLKGQWYKLTFDVKSDMERAFKYTIQRDGSADDIWTAYAGDNVINLAGDNQYQTIEKTFKMKSDTDVKSILSFSMGAVNGVQITEPHRICIDNISLEMIDEPESQNPPAGDATELLINPNFTDTKEPWIFSTGAGGEATATFENGVAKVEVTNPGTQNYGVQLAQNDLTFEEGASYVIKFNVKSSVARKIGWSLIDPSNGYKWYTGEEFDITDEVTQVEVPYTCPVGDEEHPGTESMAFQINMGYFEGACDPSTIEISGISIKKQVTVADRELLINPNFTDTKEPWIFSTGEGGEATATFENGVAKVEVTNPGTQNYGAQLAQNDLTFEEGASYVIRFKVKSSVARKISWSLIDPSNGYKWYTGAEIDITDEVTQVEVPYTCPVGDEEHPGTESMAFQINMGYFEGACDPSTIEISEISIVKVAK